MSISPLISTAPTRVRRVIEYPDSDGQPMSDNTKQFRYIVTLKEGLEQLFKHDSQVFVAGDLLWYPQKGQPKIRQAPDALVVFGRPKGDRGSYKQWLEEGIAPQVVFEVLSPGNTIGEMLRKFRFYEEYGIDEYYVYDPQWGRLEGWLRRGAKLEPISPMPGWVSPRLGVRFELEGKELYLYQPNGERVLGYQEVAEKREQAEARAKAAEVRAQEAEAALQIALAELARLQKRE